MSLVKEKWVRADLREMEFFTEKMLRQRLGGPSEPVQEERSDALS